MQQFYRGLPQFCKVFSRAACTDEAYYKPGASPVLATCPQITPPIAMYEHPNDQASLYTCHSFAKFQLGTIIAHYFDVAQDVSGAVSGAAAPMRFLHLCAAPAIRMFQSNAHGTAHRNGGKNPDSGTFHPIPRADASESGEYCRYQPSVWGAIRVLSHVADPLRIQCRFSSG